MLRCGIGPSTRREIVFIHGPEYPNTAWSYGAARRCGVLLNIGQANGKVLDARDMVEPFTPVLIGVGRTYISFRLKAIGSVSRTKMSILRCWRADVFLRKRTNALSASRYRTPSFPLCLAILVINPRSSIALFVRKRVIYRSQEVIKFSARMKNVG